MLALYLLALCVLVLEVTLTRVFSVMSWHHFAYLIISLALLGFGAGTGALVALAGINWIGAEATIYATAALAAVAALVLRPSARSLFGAVSLAALVCMLLMTGVAARREIFPVYFPPDKIFRLAMDPHYHAWNVVARVDVLGPEPGSWG